jgi:hypothetical protein
MPGITRRDVQFLCVLFVLQSTTELIPVVDEA